MFGILALILTAAMIYTLVKNALVGTQLNKADQFSGTVDLIIPITPESEFYLEPWQNRLQDFQKGNIRIHILIDGHHHSISAWQLLKGNLPNLEIHSFVLRPVGRKAVPWMIEQVQEKISGDIVVIGDPELVPEEATFLSLGKIITEKQKAYFVLPQTAKKNILGEAIAVLNPTLALASVFGFRKIRKNIAHPLLSISQGYMAMPLKHFKEMEWAKINIHSWKEAIAKAWDIEGKTYALAFGERLLQRFYPDDVKTQVQNLTQSWGSLWRYGERMGIALYLVVLFLWAYPVLCFLVNPFSSIASILLLILYRFFTKIVFQERWWAMALHLVAASVCVGSFAYWVFTMVKQKVNKKPVKTLQ